MIFFTGEQKTLSIDVKDANGNAVDLTLCSDIIAYFIVNGTENSKYALVTQSGYGALTLDAITGRFNITILATSTVNLTNGLTAYIGSKLKYSDGTKIETNTKPFTINISLLRNE